MNRTLLWALRGVMRLFVRATVVPEDAIQRLRGRARAVLYVLEERNVSDLVALELACMKGGLRRPGKRLKLRTLDLAHSVVALERRAGVLRRRADRRTPRELAQAVAAAAADEALELDIVPVAVYWGRAPQRERSFLRLVFSENWALVGPFRRVLSILVNGRSTLIRFGEARALRSWVAAGPEGARGARRLLRDLRAEFRHMRTDTLGPDLSRRRAIIAQVLRTRAVRQAVRQEIAGSKRSRRDGLRVARRHALEIAANYSHAFVRVAERILDRLLNGMYDGVEVANAEYLDRLPPACEIVYVPCHRSHVDYLLLSYVIYRRGYAVPYVAAGINLNLPVIGRFLRKGGGFFIRRSFRGSGLYPIVFMKYVDVMMNRGHPIEFFIEGGRSRTGRLLRPRTGMLTMTLRSFLRDARRPVAYVPVYFGYDRLLEAETYIDELQGRPKQKETVGGLLRVIPMLRRQQGRVHIGFGEPLLLDGLLDQLQPGWRADAGDENARPAWFGDAVDAVATEIMRRINAAAAVTPVNLLSVALLAAPRQAMVEADLERQLQLYLDLLKQFPYSPDVSVAVADGAAIVRYCEQMGMLERRAHPLGDVLRMVEKNAVLATYYRNNVLHLFALPSLVACAFLNNPAMRHEDIQRLVWRVYPYIRQELFLRWREEELPGVVDGVLAALAAQGLLERVGDGTMWRRPPTGSAEAVRLSVLAQATVQTIERYYLAIALLLRAGRSVLSTDALEQRCVAMAQRMSMLYGLAAPEFFDRAMFRDFIELLRLRGVIRQDGEGRLTFDDALLAVAEDARIVLSEQIRNSILQVTHS
ncbi:MAG: glycerol-3-phosphate 1-O-acyltransferase PlsB [Steroidobacteraceae bacterium]|nr:glycerol-3-phosphate 1-O-acyltransferase PlsB [Steroidobacteraceae bacterium]